MLVATLCIFSVAVHTVIGQKSDRGRSRIRDAENSVLIAIDAPVIVPRLRSTARIINVVSWWEKSQAFADILTDKFSVRDWVLLRRRSRATNARIYAS